MTQQTNDSEVSRFSITVSVLKDQKNPVSSLMVNIDIDGKADDLADGLIAAFDSDIRLKQLVSRAILRSSLRHETVKRIDLDKMGGN